MNERALEIQERLLDFSVRIIRLCAALPKTDEARLVRGQLLKSATSPGAQYREACRARSAAEFISKMESAQQELDETDYWLLIIERTELMPRAKLAAIQEETRELIRVFAASVKTAKKNKESDDT